MIQKKDFSLFEAKPEELNPYEQHFLLENPFPGSGETGFDVCTDQDDIKKGFVYILQKFSPDAKRFRINGENGSGKTNILRYFAQLTDDARRNKLINNLYPVYISSPGESYLDIHEQIVDKLTGSFLSDLIVTLQLNHNLINTLSSKIKPARELLKVIKAITQPTQMSFSLWEERQKDTFVRWLKGQEKLTAVEKKFLTDDGVPPIDITSSSLAIRFLHGLLTVLKELDLCHGTVLLFDEFEEIFEGLTRSRQSKYAQDLRHLLDTLKESIFFVIATVPQPKDLAQYPAIERRLGDPVVLQPISSFKLAIDYVEEYLNSGRNKYETYLKQNEKEPKHPRPEKLKPLTEELVKDVYDSLREEVEAAQLDVLPGYFLPKMREHMRQIVENGNR